MTEAHRHRCTTVAAGIIVTTAILVISNATFARAQVTIGDAFPEYRCPAAGTEVVGSDGTRIRYVGVAEGTTMMCLIESAGPRLLGLPPSIGAWARVSPQNLEQVFRTGRPYFLVGDRPNPCREVPASGPWPPPDITQYIGTTRRLSIPALSLDVIIFRFEELKRTCDVRTEFEMSEFWIDVAKRVPVRVSIHRSLGPPVLPARMPREERIEWRAVSVARDP